MPKSAQKFAYTVLAEWRSRLWLDCWTKLMRQRSSDWLLRVPAGRLLRLEANKRHVACLREPPLLREYAAQQRCSFR
jgi:hypothetical protein